MDLLVLHRPPQPLDEDIDAIPAGACEDTGYFSVPLDATGAERRNGSSVYCDIGAVEAVELPIFVDGFDET